MLKIILCLVLLFIIPGRSYSFDDKEHHVLSTNAFMLALIHAVNTHLMSPAKATQLKSCFADDNDKDMNYGTLSELPDYVADPSELIKFYTSHSNSEHEFNCVEAKKNIFNLSKRGWTHGLTVARHNEGHFQGGPLIKFDLWHNLALQYAVNGNLTIALVLNAFAAHYLEDFFAPGHMFTPRADVNNIISKALHEIHNKEGAEIKVTTKTTKKLKVYLKDSMLFKGDSNSDGKAILKEVCIKELKENMAGMGVNAIEEKNIIKLKENMTEKGVNAIEEKMKIYGDSKLVKKNQGQRELIIYEVAESVTAIFKAYKCKKLPDTIISFYSSGTPTNELEINASYDDISYNNPTKEIYLQDPFGIGQWVSFPEITPYLSTSLKQGISPRGGVEIDMATYYMPSLSNVPESEKSFFDRFFDEVFLGGAVGYDYSRDAFEGRDFSHGPLIKFMIDDRNLDIGLSFYAKYIFNDEKGHKFQSVPWGGRLSLYLDYFSIFIGVGTETRYNNEKENVMTLYSGLTVRLSKPFEWLEEWLGAEKK